MLAVISAVGCTLADLGVAAVADSLAATTMTAAVEAAVAGKSYPGGGVLRYQRVQVRWRGEIVGLRSKILEFEGDVFKFEGQCWQKEGERE